MIFASSREVYGNAKMLPVDENTKFCPVNVYAKTKVEGEKLIAEAASAGFNTNICRFSNVYGSVDDHSDRVVVAFARRSAQGGVISVEGGDNMFDFTHVNDVSEGLFRLVEATSKGERLPPVHFVSGNGTTLNNLARLAVSHAKGYSEVTISEAPPRNFDVSRFMGNPVLAKNLLGWEAQTLFPLGFEKLVIQFRKAGSHISVPWLHLLMDDNGI
ncbi:NAD-dependent epimerase/dehydratase family protein [Candidatus Erwinia dacicola]|nr:NAD-dependent epimerase/dehydratase family protein [Candidatus Erwinia dacicola]